MAKKNLAARQRGEAFSIRQAVALPANVYQPRKQPQDKGNMFFGWARKLMRLRFRHDLTEEEPGEYDCEALLETYFSNSGYEYHRELFSTLHPDTLGDILKLRPAERLVLRCYILKPHEMSWEEVWAERDLQREHDSAIREREKKRKQRLANGIRPHNASKSQTRPWEHFGIGRRQWERRGRPEPPSSWIDSRRKTVP